MNDRRRRPQTSILLLLGALLAPTSLAGCGSGGGEAAQTDTTVLVYMFSNLEQPDPTPGAACPDGNATCNIKEMMTVGSTASMNVLIQTGGASKAARSAGDPSAMQPENIDWRRVQRYVVNKGSLRQVGDLGPELPSTNGDNPMAPDPQPAVNMGSATTLEGFLRFGVEKYPAKRYIVVLWDHGGGVNQGIGPDEVTKSSIPVPQISQALAKVKKDLGVTFEITGFDACLMATAEVAASLVSSSSYMVASEDLEPGSGWDYAAFLGYVATNPTATGVLIGTKIADTYKSKQEKEASGSAALTLSVTDLSKIPALIAATDGLAVALKAYTVNTPANRIAWKQIAMARARALDWATSAMFVFPTATGGFASATDLVDVRQLTANLVTYINTGVGWDEALSSAGDAVASAVGQAVVYNVATGGNSRATGLSMYFPSILRAYPTWKYAASTTGLADQAPYFAARYTNGTDGWLESYSAFYLANKPSLEATVTMSPPLGAFKATVSNDFAYVLAAHEAASCALYSEGRLIDPAPPCFDGMREVQNAVKGDAADQWIVDLAASDRWPLMGNGDGTGSKYPAILVPDEVAGAAVASYDRYLVPVFVETAPGTFQGGYLSVQEVVPPAGGAITYRTLGFTGTSSIPGKISPLRDGEVYWLGAYYLQAFADGTSAYLFAPSSNEVKVGGGVLGLSLGSLGSGRLGYVVTDLTGLVNVTANPVPYAP